MSVKIIRYFDVIPRHKTLKWAKRDIQRIKKIVVHQLASPAYPESLKDIDNNIKYFVRPGNHIAPNGCPYIPYHIIIDDDGKVYWTNPFEDISWHCKGHNTESIGIAVMGSFDGPEFKGKDGNPTKAQINSLIHVLNGFIMYMFNNLSKTDVYGHCELDPIRKPSCPGDGIMNVLKQWRNTNG